MLEHIPAIKACPHFELRAIYSRSKSSAETLSSEAGEGIDIYYDSLSEPSRSLDELLRRPYIHAVTICLPITAQPNIIRKAIEAGKHVLSEKPIAKDVAAALELIQWYNSIPREVVWGVAENLRFLESIAFAATKLREIGGNVATFRMALHTFTSENDKFFRTEWYV
jgi:predicted dehydrogenase